MPSRGRRLGHSLPGPSAIDILAVEARDTVTFSERMTPELESRYPELVEEMLRAVRALLAGVATAGRPVEGIGKGPGGRLAPADDSAAPPGTPLT